MPYTANQNNLPDTVGQSHEGFLVEFSRRQFVQMLMLGGVSLAIPPQIAKSQQTQDFHKEIERVAGLVNKAQTEEPDLHGFRNMQRWVADTFPKNFSQQDAEVLQGALYLKALKLLEENRQRKAPAPTLDTVREVFTNPKPINCVTKGELNNLLKTTQMKMSRQPDFAREVKEASEKTKVLPSLGLTFPCPPWCAVIVIIVIIIVIIVTV